MLLHNLVVCGDIPVCTLAITANKTEEKETKFYLAHQIYCLFPRKRYLS